MTVTESDKKTYIPVYINKYRVVGMMDSGSNVSIIHHSLLKRIKYNRTSPSDITVIKSFSDTDIPVLGKVSTSIRLYPEHQGLDMTLLVIDDISNAPSLLLGDDFFRSGLVQISYIGSPSNPHPSIVFMNPSYCEVQVMYTSPADCMTCETLCQLSPYEQADLEFSLSRAAPVVRTDHILISATEIATCSIIPSRTDLQYVPNLQSYVGTARVVNLSDRHVNLLLTGKFEIVNTFNAIPCDRDFSVQLLQALQKHPLGREILPEHQDMQVNIPIMSVNMASTTSGPTSAINDVDLTDVLFAKDPSFTGVAEISDKIIDPVGLDIPTIMYETAEEAVKLDSFSEEIRPFIVDIFVKKFPSVVSLHSLDAGDLSRTLGFTQLRLRKGESLPRSKRIFHISPVPYSHGGGWSRKINARYLHTLMVYL